MTVYYRCDGTVSTVGNGVNQGQKCSSGWVQVDEPVYTFISYDGASGLISALLTIAAIYAVFKCLYKVLG